MKRGIKTPQQEIAKLKEEILYLAILITQLKERVVSLETIKN